MIYLIYFSILYYSKKLQSLLVLKRLPTMMQGRKKIWIF